MDAKVQEFLNFVAREVIQDDFEMNAGSFAELACRKLVDLGIMTKEEKEDGNYYIFEDPDFDEEDEEVAEEENGEPEVATEE